MSFGIWIGIIKCYNKGIQLHNNFKDNHPIKYGIIMFILGTMFGAIITHFVENTLWNTEPPYITNIYPSSNTFLNETPDAIIVNFLKKSSSGIDVDNSRINLVGSKYGLINGTINFTKNIMSFKPAAELKPDEYTVAIQVADRENPPQKDTSKFYIYGKPILGIGESSKIIEYFEKFYVNTTIQDTLFTESDDMYSFTIHNNNDESIININFGILLSGTIKKPIKFYEQGITGWEFIPGQTAIMIPWMKELYSCQLRMEIREMAPGGKISALIISDSNISNYTNPLGCYSENIINNSIENVIYVVYNVSYHIPNMDK